MGYPTDRASQVGAPTESNDEAISTSSTSAIAHGAAAGDWITIKVTGTTVYVLFGSSAVANPTSSTGWPLFDGDCEHYMVKEGETHFKAIGAAAGTLYWRKS